MYNIYLKFNKRLNQKPSIIMKRMGIEQNKKYKLVKSLGEIQCDFTHTTKVTMYACMCACVCVCMLLLLSTAYEKDCS